MDQQKEKLDERLPGADIRGMERRRVLQQTKPAAGVTRSGVVVSIFCIAILLMLLFPYLLQSRAQTRRLRCEKNLGQIGLALASYADVWESLPYGTQQTPHLPPERRLSWYPQIWPYITEETVDLPIKWTEPWDSQHNLKVRAWIGKTQPPQNTIDAPLLVCPSMIFQRPSDRPGPTSYVGIAGVGSDAANLSLADPRAGIWGYDRCTPVEKLPLGVQAILLLAETGHDVGPWTAGGTATIRGLDPARPQMIGPSGILGGNHPLGANVLMASYANRFLTNDIDPQTLAQLAVLGNQPEVDQ